MNQEAVPAASVLVVDDTIENLRLLSDLLEEHGYEVRAVTNGRQALQAVERDPPDLILLDITMPEMDGYEVCRRLKAKRSLEGRAGDLPHGVDRHGRQGPGVRRGRRRLRHQAFPVRGGPGAGEDARRAQAGAGRRWPTATRVFVPWSSCATTSCTWSSTTCGRRCRRCSSTSGCLKGPPPRSAKTAGRTCESAIESAEALSRMANDLLDVSRLEEGRMPVERAVWDLTRMARRRARGAGGHGPRRDASTSKARGPWR